MNSCLWPLRLLFITSLAFSSSCRHLPSSQLQEGLNRKQMAVFGHRGHSMSYPENSISSVRSALEKVDGAEIDIQITSDHQIVVLHDDTLARTISGEFADNARIANSVISDLSWDEVKKVRIGPEDPLPLLSDILELYKEKKFEGKQLLIEVKSYKGGDDKIQKRMVAALDSMFSQPVYRSLLPQISFISFDASILKQLISLREIGPNLSTFWIIEASKIANIGDWDDILSEIKPFTGIDLESHISLLQRDKDGKTFIDRVKSKDKKVISWVSRKKRTDGYLFEYLSSSLGVDVFTSDLDLSIWNGRLKQKRLREVHDFLGLGPKESHDIFLSLGNGKKAVIYSPVGEVFPRLDGLEEALAKDFDNIFSWSGIDGIIFHVGDLSKEELEVATAFLNKNPMIKKRVVLLSQSHLPQKSVRGVLEYEERVLSNTKIVPVCLPLD